LLENGVSIARGLRWIGGFLRCFVATLLAGVVVGVSVSVSARIAGGVPVVLAAAAIMYARSSSV
jgi:hypothetical protein